MPTASRAGEISPDAAVTAAPVGGLFSRVSLLDVIVLAAALSVALVLRVHNLARDGMWLDEIWGATFVQLNLKDLLVAVARLDVHPPLYYMQLGLWSRLFGPGDVPLLLNSVFWSIATLVLLYAAAREILGVACARLSVLLAAVAAGDIFFAREARMYSLMAFLAVLGWHAAYRFARRPGAGSAWWLVVVAALLAATQAASLVAVSSVALLAFLSLDRRDRWRRVSLATYAGIALVTLPWMVNSAFRGVSHIDPLTAGDVATTIGGWLFGYAQPGFEPPYLLGVGIVAIAVLAAMAKGGRLRLAVFSFVVWPVIVVAAISLAGRELWIERLFNFCVPFAAVAVGAALHRLATLGSGSWRTAARTAAVAAFAVLFLSMAGAGWEQGLGGWRTQFRAVAAFLDAHARPGDVIYVPEQPIFWGIARYVVGPAWGNPLQVSDPVRPATSRAWDGIYRRLGHAWLERLDLVPRTRVVDHAGVRLVIGYTPAQEVETASRLWVVSSPRLAEVELALCQGEAASPTLFRGLVVRLYDCR
jgi:uncharacterized membrane protein